MPLVTANELADRLKVTPSAVRAAIRQGRIPSIRLGRRVRIQSEVVDAIERLGMPVFTRREANGQAGSA